MAVDVQSESRRRVAEVFLHRLDIVARADRGHGIAVSEVVEPDIGATNS